MKKTTSILSIVLTLLMLLNVTSFAAGGNGSGGGNGENPLSVVSVTAGGKNLSEAPIGPEGEITIIFDRGMTDNQAANFEQICFTDKENNKVEGVTLKFSDFQKNDDGNTYTVLTYSGLKNGEYNLKLGKDLKANNGKTLGEDAVFACTVEGAPEEETNILQTILAFVMNIINTVINFIKGLFAQ